MIGRMNRNASLKTRGVFVWLSTKENVREICNLQYVLLGPLHLGLVTIGD